MPPVIQNAPHGAPKSTDAKPRPNPAATPAASYTPVDTTIPPALYDKIPNLELYKQLKEAEKKIELVTTRKALHFQAVNAKTNQILGLKKETGLLRVFVYNTAENQPWQNQLKQERGVTLPEGSPEATWTFRVEGRLLNENEKVVDSETTQKLKFSSFLSGISVDIIPNDDYPELQNSNSNIIEWRDETIDQQPGSNYSNSHRKSEFDGIDVKRPGVFPIKVKVAIMVRDLSYKFKLSREMAQFVGKEEATQQELIYLIWEYVLYKDLFNYENFTKVPAIPSATEGAMNSSIDADDKQLSKVECDTLLTELLGVSSFVFSDLYKLLQPHFAAREPIIMEYEVNPKKSTTLGDMVFDIPVELPMSSSKAQYELIESTKATYERLHKADLSVQQLNNSISLGIVALQNANAKEVFYRELSEDPVVFMKKWLKTQLETFKALKSDEGYDEETVRQSNYFVENEELLRDKIDVLLGSGRF